MSESHTASTGEPSKRSRSPSPAPTSEPPQKKQALDDSIPSTETDKDQPGPSAPVELEGQPDATKQTTDESQAAEKKSNHPKGNGRYQGKGGKQGRFDRNKEEWGTPREKKEGAGSGDEGGEKRLPKKKVAVLIGYCGTGYSGMQIQTPGTKTIEGDVWEALIKAGAVSEANAVDHRKVDVQRAARTDAGVHAAGNVISMKLIVEPPLPEGHPNLASYVNSFLPEQIRMWGFVRTMKSFMARTACDSRKYEYLLPSYCLLPPLPTCALAKKLDVSSPGWREALGEAAKFSDAGVLPPSEEGEDGKKIDPKTRGEYERRRGWRVDQPTLQRFRDLIKEYTGTHNYHNYTIGKPFNERSVKRHMISLVVNDPVVVGEIEWISVQIHGQSFMLHQIRKMLSMAMLACRTASPPKLIPETFGPKRIHVPKAPPLGLLLEAPQFGLYNQRIKDQKNGLQGERDPIDWDIHEQNMKEFKMKYIYDRLRQDELETHVYHKWMRQMDNTEGDLLSFLNSKGTIPPEAEIAKRQDEKNAAEKKGNGEGKKTVGGDMDSDDEDVDQDLLKRGELEG